MKKLFILSCLLVSLAHAQGYDTALTELSRYIGGLPCETSAYQLLQSDKSYQEHINFTQNTWKEFTDSTIIPARKWAIEKGITESTDTGACFYPFSGPDFLFANTFFPNSRKYVLMGLERCGTFTAATKMKPELRIGSLTNIRHSLRYMVRSGYFVTSHMGSDLTKSQLNGTLHLILYFVARTGHTVQSLEYGYIDSKGNFAGGGNKPSSQYFSGMHLIITDTAAHVQKDLYYFSCDIADYKIGKKDYLTPFVKGLGNMNTYLKSASYIPAHKNFSIVRNSIVNNSLKILQDDTGIPYKILKDTTKFEFQMWGTYTKTIKDLEWGFQSDLKEAVQKSPENKSLPFRISYNGNYGEGLMMYARKKVTSK